MRRGTIVSVAGSGDFAGKPRPAVVVQANLFNEHHPAVTLCPISSALTGDDLFRVPIPPTDENGLRHDSEIAVDRVQSVWRRRIGSTIGTASPAVMNAVDVALRRWLSL